MNDVDDLYSDLPTETTSDYIKKLEDKVQDYNEKIYELKKKVEKLEGFMSSCQRDKNHLSRENEVLKRNISSLFNTAKSEVQRKDKIISELHVQYEDLHFRRTKLDLPNSKRTEEPPESYPQHRYKSSRDAESNSLNRNSRHGRKYRSPDRQPYDNRDKTDVRRDKTGSRSSSEKRTSAEQTDSSRRRPVSPQYRPRSPNLESRQTSDNYDRVIAHRDNTGSRLSNEKRAMVEQADSSHRRPVSPQYRRISPNLEYRQTSDNYDRVIAHRDNTGSRLSNEKRATVEQTDSSRRRPVSPQYRRISPNQKSRQALDNHDKIVAYRDKTEFRLSNEKRASFEQTDGSRPRPVSPQNRSVSPNLKSRQALDNHDKIVAYRDKTEFRLSNEKRASFEQTDGSRPRPVSPQNRSISPNLKSRQALDNHDKIVAYRDKTEFRLSNEKRASFEQTDGFRPRPVSTQDRSVSPNLKSRQAFDNHDKIGAYRDKTEFRLSNEKMASAEQTEGSSRRLVAPNLKSRVEVPTKPSGSRPFVERSSEKTDPRYKPKLLSPKPSSPAEKANQFRLSQENRNRSPKPKLERIIRNPEPTVVQKLKPVIQPLSVKIEEGSKSLPKKTTKNTKVIFERLFSGFESPTEKVTQNIEQNSSLWPKRMNKTAKPRLSVIADSGDVQTSRQLLSSEGNYVDQNDLISKDLTLTSSSESDSVGENVNEKVKRNSSVKSAEVIKNSAPPFPSNTNVPFQCTENANQSGVVNEDSNPRSSSESISVFENASKKVRRRSSNLEPTKVNGNLDGALQNLENTNQEVVIRDSESKSEKIQNILSAEKVAPEKSATVTAQIFPQPNSQPLPSDDRTVNKYPHYTPLKFINGELISFPFRLPKPMSPIANTPDYLKEKFNSETNKISPVIPMINENRILDKPVVPMKEQNEQLPAKSDLIGPATSNNESSTITENHVNHVVSVKNRTPYKNCGVMEIKSSCVMNSEAAENSTATKPVLSFTHDFEQGEFSRKGRKRPQIAIRYSDTKIARVDCS